MTTAIYALSATHLGCAHVTLMQQALRDACAEVITVQFGPDPDGRFPDDDTLRGAGTEPNAVAALNAAIAHNPAVADQQLVVTTSHAIGPLRAIGEILEIAEKSDSDLFASYWHDLALDPRFGSKEGLDRIPYLDFAVFGAGVLANIRLQAELRKLPPPRDDHDALRRVLIPFAQLWKSESKDITYAMAADRLETFEPRLSEVHKLVADKAPVIPLAVLELDPVQHDLQAIYMREALDGLRVSRPEVYSAVIDYASRHMAMREFNTIADQYEILPLQARYPQKAQWAFGRVAVFLHAYYAEMMPEFWDLVTRLPCDADLFITTASQDHKLQIEEFVRNKGWPDDAITVRVVEQNRGRDMSSLFITWRDIILRDQYEVALRLHSKRTPQVPRQVGESFKSHLFDNLVASPGYVANILDLLEAEPDIGLAIPPVIHMGFGTLGHSWYTNKKRVQKLLKEMNLNVRVDESTPVAPYGTMYWFRTEALKPMFAHPWAWESYNAEPHHVDGGLAHAQERLIGYVAQGQGFRVSSVMNPRYAARSYAKLEYKLQKLASYLAIGSIQEQVGQLEAANASFKMKVFRRLKLIYGAVLIRYPSLRGPLRPIKDTIVKIMSS